METKKYVSDNLLILAHLLFIIFSFLFAILTPFYCGLFLIFFHKAHEIYFGECYFTLIQQKYNYSEENEDFFQHLFNKLNIDIKKSVTSKIHLFIKTIILIIVVIKMYLYFISI